MNSKEPFLWFLQRIDGYPKPWMFFKIDGLMVNAYEILKKNSKKEKVKTVGIHNYLNFKGPIMMDSGGYLFLRNDNLDVNAETILKLYKESKPDIGVVLDHPLSPNLSKELIMERLNRTLENTKFMVNNNDSENLKLIPVIHGHNVTIIRWYIRKLKKLGDFETYGIGSLVPYAFRMKGSRGLEVAIKIILEAKKMLPNKKIHVFGIGSTLTMHLMFFSGVSSVDSSSWRTKAAFGAIQLPGIGDRYITPKKKSITRNKLSREERKILEECECPACKAEGYYGLKHSFKLRALHNAWVFQKEVEKARKLLKNDEYDDYIWRLIGKSKYHKVLDLICEHNAT